MKKIVALLMLLTVSSAAYGADLDAPAAPSKPTVRTELKRGHDIAFNCALQSPMDILVYEKCIDNALSAQLQQGTNTEAFELGLYFTAVSHAKINYNILAQHGHDTTLAASACKMYVAGVIDGEKALKLDDKTVASVLHLNAKGLQVIKDARQLYKGSDD